MERIEGISAISAFNSIWAVGLDYPTTIDFSNRPINSWDSPKQTAVTDVLFNFSGFSSCEVDDMKMKKLHHFKR